MASGKFSVDLNILAGNKTTNTTRGANNLLFEILYNICYACMETHWMGQVIVISTSYVAQEKDKIVNIVRPKRKKEKNSYVFI